MIGVEDVSVGMPVSIGIGSDSYPYEVVGFKGKNVLVREVRPINKGSFAEGCISYEYESDPNGEVRELSCRGKHGWHVQGDYRSPSYGWCYRVHFGRACYYRDPSF